MSEQCQRCKELEAENQKMSDWLDTKARALANALGHSPNTQTPPMDMMVVEVERLCKAAQAAKEVDDA